MEEEKKLQVFSILEGQQDAMVKALQRLIRIPSIADKAEEGRPYGRNVGEALDACLSIASELGLSARQVDGQMGVIDINEEPPYLGYLCHLDVVPAGSGWSVPPFEGVVKGSRIYGRGSTDNKGAAVSALFAMAAVRQAGIDLPKGVRLLTGTNEERGSSDLEYYRKKEKLPPVVVTPDGMYPLINAEKGRLTAAFRLPIEDADGYLLDVEGAEAVNVVPAQAKAVLRGVSCLDIQEALEECPGDLNYEMNMNGDGSLQITVNGTGAHAATPEQGKNALTALYLLLSKLPVKGVAEGMRKLAQMFPYGENHGESSGVFCEDPISGKITLVNSRAHYENGIFTGELDIRFPVTWRFSQIEDRLSRQCALWGMELENVEGSEGHYTDASLPYVQTLLRIFEENTGKEGKALSMGGGTYVHNIEGGVAYGILMPGEEPVPTHGADEYLILDHLVLNAKILAQAILELCGQ